MIGKALRRAYWKGRILKESASKVEIRDPEPLGDQSTTNGTTKLDSARFYCGTVKYDLVCLHHTNF